MRRKSVARLVGEPIAIAVALALLVRAAVQIYAIPSDSMSPTLEPGDYIVVTPYLRGAPDRGHVVVFQSGDTNGELMVKRVIGVAGDLVDSRLGRVRIGGTTLAEPYVLRSASTGSIEPQLVPKESYYVLGDNRDVSMDSRNWGVVPRSAIVGRARMVLWSAGALPTETASAAATPRATRAANAGSRGRLFKCID